MIRFFVTAAIAATMAAGAAAQAAPVTDDETYSVAIRIGDLDLASPAGQATFNGRVKRAADSVCGFAVGSISQVDMVDQCRVSLMRTARAQTAFALRSTDAGTAGTR